MKKRFQNQKFVTVFSFIALAVALVNILFFIKDSLFYDMKVLPDGKLLNTVVSPNLKYSVKIYAIPESGTLDSAIKAEIKETATGKTRNIYWETGIDSATVSWGAKDTVIINNHPINVIDGEYDWRDDISSRKIADRFQPKTPSGRDNIS